jgi:hypothetical protein
VATAEERAAAKAAKQDKKRDKGLLLRKGRKSTKTSKAKRDRGWGR